MRACVRVCAVCGRAGSVTNRLTNRIYTSGRENSLRKGFPLLRVFVAPLTFRRFLLGSAGSGSFSGTVLALNPVKVL